MNKEQRTTLLHILAAAAMLVILHFLPWHTILRFSAPVNRAIQILLYLIPYLTVGHEVLLESLHNIKEGEFFDEAFLMMLATVGAIIIGEYPEATAVMLFYEVGELFSDVAEDRSRRSISSLLDIIPQKAIVLREGQEEELPPEEIEPGELLLVRPGERIPLDGEVVEGISSLNTAALTGESLPVNISVGDQVLSGAINLTSAIQVRATAAYQDSTVARILELVENSNDQKSHSEKFISRFAKWYTPLVVLGAALIALCFTLFSNLGLRASAYRGLVFLVVSCPCALVVSVPLTFFCGIGAASRHGILIKGSPPLAPLAPADTLVLAKPGTLT
ncbi:MAG: HAD-IC family P-type ATPase, partial [Clostridiales bacterium]|nr:HAD-IC family P-type ATPase [Candidatus Scatonaster coprocaballi]